MNHTDPSRIVEKVYAYSMRRFNYNHYRHALSLIKYHLNHKKLVV